MHGIRCFGKLVRLFSKTVKLQNKRSQFILSQYLFAPGYSQWQPPCVHGSPHELSLSVTGSLSGRLPCVHGSPHELSLSVTVSMSGRLPCVHGSR